MNLIIYFSYGNVKIYNKLLGDKNVECIILFA